MFNEPLAFENSTIVLDGVEITATCGPVRQEADERFDGALVSRMQVLGAAAELPTVEGVRVDIDGVEWEVERVGGISSTAIITFARGLG